MRTDRGDIPAAAGLTVADAEVDARPDRASGHVWYVLALLSLVLAAVGAYRTVPRAAEHRAERARAAGETI